MDTCTLAITTGDRDGIGTEITAKALSLLGPSPAIRYIIYRSKHCPQEHINLLKEKFNLISTKHWNHIPTHDNIPPNTLIDLVMDTAPTLWFEEAVDLCLKRKLDGIVTGPLSKTEMMTSPSPFLGHTELLKSKVSKPHLFMAFVGKEFNVLLATGHIPLKNISENLTEDLMVQAILKANDLRLSIPQRKNKPIGLLGLNPHAGEAGLIGHFEDQVIKRVMERVNHIPIEGPLIPDTAFLPKNWKKYSVYLCLYHDQGLIPFKMMHGQDSGVHITMGLPFVRTSVDHGTAKDLFNLNKANPNSMLDAIKWAKYLLDRKHADK